MSNTYQTPREEYMDAETSLVLIPSNLWSLAYLNIPGILQAASQVDPVRVGQIFEAASPRPQNQPDTPISPQVQSAPALRAGAPRIVPFDGSSKNLRTFCATLRNQFLGQEALFPDESSKVRFAYQCLGPGALSKMRSCFLCLEDPSVPAEIETLEEFMIALKRECEDPELRDKSTRAVEQMSQGSMRFHEFIKLFHDNIADSTYANVDKTTWKTMLERRLSSKLREVLRKKDAAIQEWQTAFRPPLSTPQPRSNSFLPSSKPEFMTSSAPITSEPTVSQGGSAMDLDVISREKGPDGRLTLQAKNARRTLGRCLWCNKIGHIRMNCPLGSRAIASATTETMSTPENLKEKLQQ